MNGFSSILSRGVLNTRPRDFYDVYSLYTTRYVNLDLFKKALDDCSEHRGTIDKIKCKDEILERLRNSKDLIAMWDNYRKQFNYAGDISYQAIIDVIAKMVL